MEHAAVNWIQIPATNLDRAVKFYTNTFGFEFEIEVLNDIDHALFRPDKYNKQPVNGAIIQAKDDVEIGLGPILFFDATGKFDVLLHNIEEFGGKVIVGKTLIKKQLEEGRNLIPNTYIDQQPGYFAHFYDSEGNRLGLYGSH